MLSSEQIRQLIAENTSLQVQVEELNSILLEREQELILLRNAAAAAAELQSRFEVQLDELQSMQDHIGKKQQEMEGAIEREVELEHELTAAARMQQQFNDLARQYGTVQSQLAHVQALLQDEMDKNLELRKMADRMGEQESQLANTVMERDELRARMAVLKNTPVAPQQ